MNRLLSTLARLIVENKKYKPGQHWKTTNGYGARNPKGDAEYFYGDHAETLAIRWAKGAFKSKEEADASTPSPNDGKQEKLPFDNVDWNDFDADDQEGDSHPYLAKFYADLESKLHGDELEAVGVYVGSGYLGMNGSLRGTGDVVDTADLGYSSTDDFYEMIKGESMSDKIAEMIEDEQQASYDANREYEEADDRFRDIDYEVDMLRNDIWTAEQTTPDGEWGEHEMGMVGEEAWREKLSELEEQLEEAQEAYNDAKAAAEDAEEELEYARDEATEEVEREANGLVDEYIERMIESLDYAFERVEPIDQKIKVFRGIADPWVEKKLMDAFKSGGTFEDAGFISTSTSRDFADEWGEILLEITVPAGTRVLAVDAGEIATGENEVILRPQTEFKIVDRRELNGTTVFVCEVV